QSSAVPRITIEDEWSLPPKAEITLTPLYRLSSLPSQEAQDGSNSNLQFRIDASFRPSIIIVWWRCHETPVFDLPRGRTRLGGTVRPDPVVLGRTGVGAGPSQHLRLPRRQVAVPHPQPLPRNDVGRDVSRRSRLDPFSRHDGRIRGH